jgi:tRNA threonylcarbamoyladenosine biosynthesis protein TsaE
MIAVETRSAKETRKAARLLAREFRPSRKGATVVTLVGELGAGKTTFVRGFARALGVAENVLSPTFVLMKIYALAQKKKDKRQTFRHLIHIDCYRLASPKDLLHLGFKELLQDKNAVILIEWAERVKKLIPRGAIWVRFRHSGHPHKRVISFYEEICPD